MWAVGRGSVCERVALVKSAKRSRRTTVRPTRPAVRMRRVTGWKWALWRLTWRLYLERAAWNVIEQDRIILESQRGLGSRDRFFLELKSILKKAPLVEQEEILIERSEVYLV